MSLFRIQYAPPNVIYLPQNALCPCEYNMFPPKKCKFLPSLYSFISSLVPKCKDFGIRMKERDKDRKK